MECPKCGEYIDRSMFNSSVTFCPFCGQDLKASPPPVNLLFCPYCGHELICGARFCPGCGKSLEVKGKKKDREQYASDSSEINKSYGGPSVFHKMFSNITRSLTYIFSPERKMRRLYGQWAEYADLSPEEIKALEAQAELSDDWKQREKILKITILAGLALIVIIVIVAVLFIYIL
jgi:hypothetical protein